MASCSTRGFMIAGLLVLALGVSVGLERLHSSELCATSFRWPWTVGSEPAAPDAELAALLEGSGCKPMGDESAAPVSGTPLRIRVGLVSQGMNTAVGGTGRWWRVGRGGARE